MVLNENPYQLALLQQLATYDWGARQQYNLYSVFFDNAMTLLQDADNAQEAIRVFNKMEKEFQEKYQMTIAQAEIRVWRIMYGNSKKRLRITLPRRYSRSGRSTTKKTIHYLDMVEDLNKMKFWMQTKLKELGDQIGMGAFQ